MFTLFHDGSNNIKTPQGDVVTTVAVNCGRVQAIGLFRQLFMSCPVLVWSIVSMSDQAAWHAISDISAEALALVNSQSLDVIYVKDSHVQV